MNEKERRIEELETQVTSLNETIRIQDEKQAEMFQTLLKKNTALRERFETIETLNREKDAMQTVINDQEKKLEKANDLAYARLGEINRQETRITYLENEIIKLKAKLYDMTNKD